MLQAQHEVTLQTRGQDLYEITVSVTDWVAAQGVDQGLLTLFCQHTSASLTIQENADPDVKVDLLAFFRRTVVEDPSLYAHGLEGPDDMPAHIRTALTDVSLGIPVRDGRLVLGTWQGIYLFEHRSGPQCRHVILHLAGL